MADTTMRSPGRAQYVSCPCLPSGVKATWFAGTMFFLSLNERPAQEMGGGGRAGHARSS